MQSIPWPELVLALVVAAILAVGQKLWGIRPFPFVPRPGDLRPGQPPASNEQLRARMIASDIILAIISLPLIARWVPPNGIYGFRVSTKQFSRAAWYSTNAFYGWALLISVMIGAAVLIALPHTSKRWTLWLAFVIPVLCAAAVSLAYLSEW